MIRILIFLSILVSCTSHDSGKKNSETKASNDEIDPNSSSSQNQVNTTPTSFKLVPHHIHLNKNIDFNLNIPEGYDVSIAAENLHRLRFLAKSPDGKLFATDMYNLEDNFKGAIYIFEEWDPSNHRFKKIVTYLNHLHNPNQVTFYGKYIYVSETDKLSRYIYKDGDTIPSSSAEIIATFPAYGLSYKYGGWHLTRSLAFHNNKLYISVGSSCNACIEKEDVRACILEMNPDGSHKKIFARGLRNSVAIKWIGNKLWATSMGRDLIGADKPEDLFQTVEKNGYYGWPFYYQYQHKVYADEQFKDSVRAAWVKEPPVAFCGFKAHSAPLGFDYFKNFKDPLLNNSFLVALHGSTTVSRLSGNAIVKIISANKYEDVVNGFLTGTTEESRHGRACDVMMNDDHSFFFTDDKNGVLYYVWKEIN
jgi:glucose/arabinose dehydrogenase